MEGRVYQTSRVLRHGEGLKNGNGSRVACVLLSAMGKRRPAGSTGPAISAHRADATTNGAPGVGACIPTSRRPFSSRTCILWLLLPATVRSNAVDAFKSQKSTAAP